MRKIYAFLTFVLLIIAANAQTADYQVLGFADENGNPTSFILMNSTQDLQPRVILKNNGPDVAAITDTLVFDIYYNESEHITSMLVLGAQVQQLTAGEQAIIDLVHPIWTADVMNEYSLITCTICYELRLVGVATDPNPNNNRACIPVTRELDIADADASFVTMFPNPATSVVTFSGVENASVQLFDLSGKRISYIEKASENQQIDVSSLAPGLYIVRVFDGKNSCTKKLDVIR